MDEVKYYQSDYGYIYAQKGQNVYVVEKDKTLTPTKTKIDLMWSGVEEDELDELLKQFPYNKKD